MSHKVMKFKDGMPLVASAVASILEIRKQPGYGMTGRMISRHVGVGDVTLYVRCGAQPYWVTRAWDGSVVVISTVSLPPSMQGRGFISELTAELAKHFDYVCFESVVRNPRFECWLEANQFSTIIQEPAYGLPRNYYRKSVVV